MSFPSSWDRSFGRLGRANPALARQHLSFSQVPVLARITSRPKAFDLNPNVRRLQFRKGYQHLSHCGEHVIDLVSLVTQSQKDTRAPSPLADCQSCLTGSLYVPNPSERDVAGAMQF